MKYVHYKLLVVIVLLLVQACSKSDESEQPVDIFGKWEVEEFMSVESVLYAKKDDFNPLIYFKTDGTLEIQLDVNSCFGDFELLDGQGINIDVGGCTEACCDSDFSLKLIKMLSQVNTYEVVGDKMQLHVSNWGWIELTSVSD